MHVDNQGTEICNFHVESASPILFYFVIFKYTQKQSKEEMRNNFDEQAVNATGVANQMLPLGQLGSIPPHSHLFITCINSPAHLLIFSSIHPIPIQNSLSFSLTHINTHAHLSHCQLFCNLTIYLPIYKTWFLPWCF